MPETHLLVIPLPNGTDGAGNARMSIFFSPRLVGPTPNGALRDYPWRDWPAVLNDPAFGMAISMDTGPVPGFTVTSPPADPAVWAAVFGDGPTSEVEVEPWQQVDRTDIEFPVSYSPGQMSNDALTVYRQVAIDYPEYAPTGGDLATIPSITSLLGSNLDAALEFMKPLESKGDPVEPTGPSLEFHATITNLAAHPELLRLLGLVVDVEFPLPAATPTGVTVRTNYAGMFPGAAGPAFQVRFGTMVDADFRPLPNPDPQYTDQLEGFLPLGDGEYAASSVDTLVASQRLGGFRSTSSANGHEAPLPAMREHGISVIRKDMRTVLRQKFIRQFEIEEQIRDQLANPSLPAIRTFAEDITQGQRYDARETGNTSWRSIFERHAPEGYVFPSDVSVPALDVTPDADEGWQGFTLMTEANPVIETIPEKGLKDRTPQRIHDAIFRWNGWSAATRMPGRMLDGASGVAVEQQDNAPGEDDPVQFKVDYRPVPATLPLLRYGHTYDLRARCVDFAGNSRIPSDTNPTAAEITETFGRLQPVEPPTVVRRSARPIPGVGDNTTTIVIKSEHDQADGTVDPSDRLLFPPRLSQHRVELHDLPNGGIDPATYRFLAQRDAKDLTSQTVEDPLSGEIIAGELVDDEVEPGRRRPTARYLVDPVVAGAALEGLPGATDTVVVPYGGQWPNPKAIRFQLKAGDRDPRVFGRNAPTSVRVWLPKACTATVSASSALDEFLITHFKLWHELSDADRADLRDLIVDGRHWMISPRDVITLVHAVRLPLTRPHLDQLSADRPSIGATVAEFTGAATLDRKSTADLKLNASWTDPVDDVASDAPAEVTTQAVLARLAVSLDGDPGAEEFNSLEMNMHDTKRHQVSINSEAFSRFSRYFTEETEVSFEADDTVSVDERGVVASSVTVTAGGTAYVVGDDYTVEAAEGTITWVSSESIPAGPIMVSFIPRPVSRVATEGNGQTTSVLVPNAAPPIPPIVEEILPAFERTVNVGEESIEVNHNASLLRVYVRRPWWSTGEGETLGVLLDPATVPAASVTATRLGRDPILPGAGSDRRVSVADLARASITTPAIDGHHDVAGHDVTFDPDRKLWSADIELTTDLGYRPFIGLALARYQPESIAGAHISPIVYPDPIRIGASRTATVDLLETTVGVTVEGPDGGNEMTVAVQRSNPEVKDTDLAWETIVPPVQLTRDPAGSRWSTEISLPDSLDPIRLLIEDSEPITQLVDGKPTPSEQVVYVETVDLPGDWVPGS